MKNIKKYYLSFLLLTCALLTTSMTYGQMIELKGPQKTLSPAFTDEPPIAPGPFNPDYVYSDYGNVPFRRDVGWTFLADYYNDNMANHGRNLEAVYTGKGDTETGQLETVTSSLAITGLKKTMVLT